MQLKSRTELNKILPSNPVVAEVGVAEGLLTEYILKNWNPGLLYCVDNWGTLNQTGDGGYEQTWHNKNYAEVLHRIEPYKEKVRILRGLSWNMAQHIPNNSLDLCYIDACHMYECVVKDIEAYWPKLQHGGVMGFHDFCSMDYGVNKAVLEYVRNHNLALHHIPENHWSDASAYFFKP